MRRDHAGGTVTPEAVRLQADIAGVGSRSIAWLVDTFIQLVVLLPVVFVLLSDGSAGTPEAVAISLLAFIMLWLYYPAFELLRRGQTPGKRVQGIRVVRTNGQPAGLAPIAVRNLVRVIEVILLPFVALIACMVTARSQRLGDLAAGTMVVRERKLPAPHVLPLRVQGEANGPTLDTSRMSAHDYTLLRTFISRRSSLDPKARQQLAARLATRVREQLGERPGDPMLADEQLIEAAAHSYRARFATDPG
jgi:uncharacterized RDD family membrane protein YckC